jgi:hypothetical protein
MGIRIRGCAPSVIVDGAVPESDGVAMKYPDVIDLVCEMDVMIAALKEFGYWDVAEALKAVQLAVTGSVPLTVAKTMARDVH